jgi:hypothetical protein
MPETTRADDYEQLLVLCPTCDEPFVPRFPARCEWCGHRFRYEHEPPGTDLPIFATSLSGPIAFVAIGLVLFAAVVFGWFYYILR